jgi:hypothetical protein
MHVTKRLGAVALASCLTCRIAGAGQANPDNGIVYVSKVALEADALSVHGENTCAAAHVSVNVEGLNAAGRTPPTVTASLAGVDSKPAGVTIKVNSLKGRAVVTSSPADFTFRVCATGLPEGAASGTMTVNAALLKVSPESEWMVRAATPGADSATFTVNRGPDKPSEKPSLTLIVTPVDLRMAKQNGEAIFQFDVAASEGFTGTVLGNISISEPGNPDGIELQEGTKAGSLSFTFGAGQKLSDAHNLIYRIRTTANNQREGVLIYSISLSSAGGEVTTRSAFHQVRIKVGEGDEP